MAQGERGLLLGLSVIWMATVGGNPSKAIGFGTFLWDGGGKDLPSGAFLLVRPPVIVPQPRAGTWRGGEDRPGPGPFPVAHSSQPALC